MVLDMVSVSDYRDMRQSLHWLDNPCNRGSKGMMLKAQKETQNAAAPKRTSVAPRFSMSAILFPGGEHRRASDQDPTHQQKYEGEPHPHPITPTGNPFNFNAANMLTRNPIMPLARPASSHHHVADIAATMRMERVGWRPV